MAGPGEEGEIRLKGAQVISGYLDPSLDAEAFDDEGYFRSGDLGIVDAEGYVTITGRLKDVIIRHGENISAKEVEDLLYEHPAVADVAVIGLPDPKTGERACAVVAVAEGQSFDFATMGEYLRGKGLRVNAIPEQLELVDAVPRNPAGKILKHTLRERFAPGDGSGDRAAPTDGGTHEPGSRATGSRSARAASSTTPPTPSWPGSWSSGSRAGWPSSPGPGRASAGARPAAWPPRGRRWPRSTSWATPWPRRWPASPPTGGTAVAYTCDVTSEESVTSTVASIVADLGPPTVVCNVAGIGGFFNTHEMPFDRWQKILAVNLTGPFLVCRAALPHLLEHGGAIVNVCSNTALMGQAYSAAYCASKGGLLMFTKALAAEYMGQGVRANVVAPGGTDTPLLGSFDLPEGADPKQLTKIMSPMGFSTPAEIAASIAFLASDESSYTTGAVLSVDGGLTI